MTPEEQGLLYQNWYIQRTVPAIDEPKWHRAWDRAGHKVRISKIFVLAAEGNKDALTIRNCLLKHRLTCGE